MYFGGMNKFNLVMVYEFFGEDDCLWVYYIKVVEIYDWFVWECLD